MSDSDVEMAKIAPMKPRKKPPSSPTTDMLKTQEKKITTKVMIHEALTELKTRKGVSSYAIKKYLEEKYNVTPMKVKYLIKKALKSGVEDGSIIQLKGIGASGSFKLAAIKEKPKKKRMAKAKKEKATKENSTTQKSTKTKMVKEKSKKEKSEKSGARKMEKVKKVKVDVKDTKEKMKNNDKPKMERERKGKATEVKKKAKGETAAATPAKKRANMMKRKSIGSIIKPPKMKPKKA